VYNARGLNSYTLYRCGSSACNKVAEENSQSSDAKETTRRN